MSMSIRELYDDINNKFRLSGLVPHPRHMFDLFDLQDQLIATVSWDEKYIHFCNENMHGDIRFPILQSLLDSGFKSNHASSMLENVLSKQKQIPNQRCLVCGKEFDNGIPSFSGIVSWGPIIGKDAEEIVDRIQYGIITVHTDLDDIRDPCHIKGVVCDDHNYFLHQLRDALFNISYSSKEDMIRTIKEEVLKFNNKLSSTKLGDT